MTTAISEHKSIHHTEGVLHVFAEDVVEDDHHRVERDAEPLILGLTQAEHDISLANHNYFRRKINASNMEKLVGIYSRFCSELSSVLSHFQVPS